MADDYINYFLAGIFAITIAHSGIGLASFAIIAQIMAILLLRHGMGEKQGWQKFFPWFVSILIVETVVGAIKPEWLLPWLGSASATVWMGGDNGSSAGFSNMWWVVGVIIIIAIFGVIWKTESDVKKYVGQSIGRISGKAWNGFKHYTKRVLKKLPFFGKFIPHYDKYITPTDEQNPVIKKLRVELWAMMNYNKRLEIFYQKRGGVKGYLKVVEVIDNALGIYRDYNKAKRHFKLYRGGWYNLTVEERKQELEESGKNNITVGWMGLIESVTDIMLETTKLTQYSATKIKNVISENRDMEKDEAQPVTDDSKRLNETIRGILSQWYNNVTWYKKARFALCLHKYLNSAILECLDQWNPYGIYVHDYNFANPEAIVYDKDGKPLSDKLGINKELGRNKLYEVDQFNRILTDVHTKLNEASFGTKDVDIRKIKRKDVLPPVGDNKPNPSFKDVLNWMETAEWEGFMNDLMWGAYHPNSRTSKNYIDTWKDLQVWAGDNYAGDDKVEQKGKAGTGQEAAFDLRALENYGLWVFWGRKYYDQEANDIALKNPYPAISPVGCQKYLQWVIREKIKNLDHAKKEIKNFVWSTGDRDYDKLFAQEFIEAAEQAQKPE